MRWVATVWRAMRRLVLTFKNYAGKPDWKSP
jgi:hypothetical protein